MAQSLALVRREAFRGVRCRCSGTAGGCWSFRSAAPASQGVCRELQELQQQPGVFAMITSAMQQVHNELSVCKCKVAFLGLQTGAAGFVKGFCLIAASGYLRLVALFVVGHCSTVVSFRCSAMLNTAWPGSNSGQPAGSELCGQLGLLLREGCSHSRRHVLRGITHCAVCCHQRRLCRHRRHRAGEHDEQLDTPNSLHSSALPFSECL